MKLISDSSEIRQICQELAKEDYIAIDTEFLRDRYYYPKLCLVQIAAKDQYYLFDTLAKDVDFSPLWQLLTEDKVLKVIHAARQDIETIYHITGKVIYPLFDTQIAVMALGYSSDSSYASIVSNFLNKNIDKTQQFSSWDKRPLLESQVKYAILDVVYLNQAYPLIKEALNKSDRNLWLDEEFGVLTNPKTYIIDPYNIWKKVPVRNKHISFSKLRELCYFREMEARRLNIPRQHFLKDQTILDIISKNIKTSDDLYKISSLRNLNSTQIKQIFEALEKATLNPLDTEYMKNKNKAISPEEKNLVDLYKTILISLAKQNNVSERLIATNDELEEFVLRGNHEIKAMKSWRYEVFGKYALEFKQEKLSLKMENGKMVFKVS